MLCVCIVPIWCAHMLCPQAVPTIVLICLSGVRACSARASRRACTSTVLVGAVGARMARGRRQQGWRHRDR
eukprot:2898973-Rhodomonas_salina.2